MKWHKRAGADGKATLPLAPGHDFFLCHLDQGHVAGAGAGLEPPACAHAGRCGRAPTRGAVTLALRGNVQRRHPLLFHARRRPRRRVRSPGGCGASAQAVPGERSLGPVKSHKAAAARRAPSLLPAWSGGVRKHRDAFANRIAECALLDPVTDVAVPLLRLRVVQLLRVRRPAAPSPSDFRRRRLLLLLLLATAAGVAPAAVLVRTASTHRRRERHGRIDGLKRPLAHGRLAARVVVRP